MRKVRRSKKCVSSAACPRSVVAIYDHKKYLDRYTVIFDIIDFDHYGNMYLMALCMNSLGDYYWEEIDTRYSRSGHGASIEWEDLPDGCKLSVTSHITEK